MSTLAYWVLPSLMQLQWTWIRVMHRTAGSSSGAIAYTATTNTEPCHSQWGSVCRNASAAVLACSGSMIPHQSWTLSHTIQSHDYIYSYLMQDLSHAQSWDSKSALVKIWTRLIFTPLFFHSLISIIIIYTTPCISPFSCRILVSQAQVYFPHHRPESVQAICHHYIRIVYSIMQCIMSLHCRQRTSMRLWPGNITAVHWTTLS